MPASEVAPESSPSLVGQVVLGRYRIVRPLARGGMGIVYLGRVEGAAGFSKPVVIKSVIGAFGSDGENEKLFAREARIVANLQHPNIVAVIDFGKVDESYVMVLEYVHGYHLGQWGRYVSETRGQLPVQQAVHVALRLLDALEFAHGVARADGTALGIVHRDISPANVLIDAQGHVKLGDFGIARSADDEFKTQQGLFRGTLPFSAPESLQGESASPKMDQYACAVVLYQMLTGKNPFKGAEAPETVARVLTHVPPPVSVLREDVPPGIESAIGRALSKNPAQRFDSVADFAKALLAGCEWTEREAADSFTAAIDKDFRDPKMAEHLGLESLTVRDASWRDAQDVTPGRVISLSSSPPIVPGSTPSGSLSELMADVDRSQVATARVGRSAMLAAARASAADIEVERPPTAPAATGKRSGLFLLLAALAAGAGAAAVIAFMPKPEPPKASRVLVIEKQGAEQGEPGAAASDPATQPAVVASDVPAEPAASAAPAAVERNPSPGAAPPPPASANRGAGLARAFQRQEGKIQRCFEQNAGSLAGDPRIAVRFQINIAGAVEEAIVTPSSVAGTPLGACLLGVARSTSFGAQPEPISFSIPIAARVVKR